jgi:hypothetical protein
MAGSNIRDTLSGLHKPRRGNNTPKKTQVKGALVPKPGKGIAKTAKATGGATPIASTFTVYSSDGLFSFTFTPV